MVQSKFTAFKRGALLVATVAVASAILGDPMPQPQGTTPEVSSEQVASPFERQRQANNEAMLAQQDGHAQSVEVLQGKAKNVVMAGDNTRVSIGEMTVNYHLDNRALQENGTAGIAALRTLDFSNPERDIHRAARASLGKILMAQNLSVVQNEPQVLGDAVVGEMQIYLNRDAFGSSPLVVDSVELGSVCKQMFDAASGQTLNSDCSTVVSNPAETRASLKDTVQARRAAEIRSAADQLQQEQAGYAAVCRKVTCG